MNVWHDNLGWGLATGVVAHIAIQSILFPLTGGMSALFLGVSQLVYIVPLAIFAARKSAREMAKGLCIVGGITFLLNAACWGIMANLLKDL